MILEPSDIAVDVVGDYFLIIDNDSERSGCCRRKQQ